jgi:hypothetical protein
LQVWRPCSGITGFEKLIYGEHAVLYGGQSSGRIIIVNGHLKAKVINMAGIDCLFVFGNLSCEKIYFHEAKPAFIRGDLHASKAILAQGDNDDDCALEHRGKNNVCVQGTAYAPRVQTWYMRLGHLNWAAGSGEEFAEDEKLEHWDHLNDKIW